jgi:hypothetical protein
VSLGGEVIEKGAADVVRRGHDVRLGEASAALKLASNFHPKHIGTNLTLSGFEFQSK